MFSQSIILCLELIIKEVTPLNNNDANFSYANMRIPYTPDIGR